MMPKIYIKNNIYYFGGDASKVTIGGLSSGAYLASFLTVVPESWDLYKNVLQLEGPLTALDQAVVYPKAVANSVGHQFASAVGCDSTDPNVFMNCLATKDILTLTQTWQGFVLLPVNDGDVFPVAPEIAITNPSLKAVKPAPTLMMAVPNSGTIFGVRYLPAILQYGWEPFLNSLFGPQLVGPLMAQNYPDSVYGPPGQDSYFARAGALISDSLWLCTMRRHATLLKAFTPDVYVAMWNVQASFFTIPPYFGVIHGTMLPFVFGNSVNLIKNEPGTFTPQEKELSKRTMKQVGHFMRTGKFGNQPAWTPEVYTRINIDNMTVVDPLAEIRFPPSGITVGPIADGTRCGLFDFLFLGILEQRINGAKIVEDVGLKGNFWPQAKF